MSFIRLRQPESQPVNPGAQHRPFVHLVFPEQEIPQPPQFIGSVRVDSQPVTQHESPAAQMLPHVWQLLALIAVQLLPQQSCVPAVHVLPQAPQFAASFGTQLPPQHISPGSQTLPHAPQLASSVMRSAQTGEPVSQQVSGGTQSGLHPSQAPSPTTRQSLAQHSGIALGHCRLQLPQAFTELRVSTHAPLQQVVLF